MPKADPCPTVARFIYPRYGHPRTLPVTSEQSTIEEHVTGVTAVRVRGQPLAVEAQVGECLSDSP